MVIATPGEARSYRVENDRDDDDDGAQSNLSEKTLLNDEELPLTPKEKIWALFNDPGSSRAASLIAIVIMGLIGISCTTFCLETLPSLRSVPMDVWNMIETVCVIIFYSRVRLSHRQLP